MPSKLLVLENISKRYGGVQALDSVDLDINAGEIHCLAGENGSGKSTMVKIISGVVAPDPGSRIFVDGERQHSYRAIDAVHRGIEVIFQDLSLFPNLTVAENIAMSSTVAGGSPIVAWKEVREIAKRTLDRIRVDLEPNAPVETLSLAEQQLVAIARALATDARFLIMDEPTAALTRNEVDDLFSVVEELKTKGLTVLFISHKLDEVLQISDRVTVLRDGRKVGTYDVKEVSADRLTALMTGRTLVAKQKSEEQTYGPAVLEVDNLSREHEFHEVTLTVHGGEIVGLTGLRGSGRSRLALSLFGLNPPTAGSVKMNGKEVRLRSVQDALRAGIGYVPENRMVEGLVANQSVRRNIVITIIRRLLNRIGLLDARKTDEITTTLVRKLDVRLPSVDAAIQTLSGGNQQKVVLAKWIATEPSLLILNGPTVGIDVAAKNSIYELAQSLADNGMGILFISEEVAEVAHNCDRVLVMHKGRVVDELVPPDISEAKIKASINAIR